MKRLTEPILNLGLLILFLVGCGTGPLTPESTSAVGSISSVAPTTNLDSSATSVDATVQPVQYGPTQWITPAFELIATPQNLQVLGMTFVPVEPTDPQAKGTISKDQAVSAALKEEPGLIHATYYSARFGILTSTHIPMLAEGRLVWMITYQGIETSSSGPPGVKHYVSHEQTNIIDAHEGYTIVSFPLSDGTPVPNPLAPTSTASVTPTSLATPNSFQRSSLQAVEGRVQKIEDRTIRIEMDHAEIILEITNQTIVWDGITWIAKIPVEIGDFVIASGTWNPDHSFAAGRIYVNIENLLGKVSQVRDDQGNATFELIVLNQKAEQVSLAPQTILYKGASQSVFQDSHFLPSEGNNVQVIGRRLKDGTVIAVNITIP